MESSEIPQELVDILDDRAGKKHSRTGPVLTTLAEILTKYDELKTRKPPAPEDQDKPCEWFSREEIMPNCATCHRPIWVHKGEVVSVGEYDEHIRAWTAANSSALYEKYKHARKTYIIAASHSEFTFYCRALRYNPKDSQQVKYVSEWDDLRGIEGEADIRIVGSYATGRCRRPADIMHEVRYLERTRVGVRVIWGPSR